MNNYQPLVNTSGATAGTSSTPSLGFLRPNGNASNQALSTWQALSRGGQGYMAPSSNTAPTTNTETEPSAVTPPLKGIKDKDRGIPPDTDNDIEETSSCSSSSSPDPSQSSSCTVPSDIRTKILTDDRSDELFGSHTVLDAISDIYAYKFRYKDWAQQIDPNATPDKEHIGVMAQDLAANPVTDAAVEEDESGYLKVNTKELTMTTFALVTELSRKIQEVEARLDKLEEK